MTWPDSNRRDSAALLAADEDNLDHLLSDEVVDGVVEPCPVTHQIVEVGFSDQPTQATLFGGTRDQYVNLGRVELRQADAEIVSDNQIGRRPAIMVRVTPACATEVRVRLVRTLVQDGFPAGSATLSRRERRLDHLEHVGRARSYTTDANGLLMIEPGLPISALGGGIYRVEAAFEHQAWVTGSNAVKVMRRFYVVPVVRYAAALNTVLTALRAIRTDLLPLGIQLQLKPEVTRPDMGVEVVQDMPVSLQDQGTSALDTTTGHLNELRPHSIAVIIGRFAEERAWLPVTNFSIDVDRDPVTRLFPPTVDLPLTDGSVSYFVIPFTAGGQFRGAQLIGSGTPTTVTPDKVDGINRFTSQLRVDIRDAAATHTTEATVRLSVDIIALRTWGAGWSYSPSAPVIYLNMHSPRTDAVSSGDVAQALVQHELGHALHLTSRGDSGEPDRPAHFYDTFNSHGVHHVGPHCKTGVPRGVHLWQPEARNAAACTMWGSVNVGKPFCSECKTTLRKVNLARGY